jgi:hypothetical protein
MKGNGYIVKGPARALGSGTYEVRVSWHADGYDLSLENMGSGDDGAIRLEDATGEQALVVVDGLLDALTKVRACIAGED